ncbi:MAG: hypothetical protein V1800_15980 [Candidatus Latescibacterota bacterium]
MAKSSKVAGIGIPALRSPIDGMKILCTSVQFAWGATDDGFGYELQYALKEDFSDFTSHVFQNMPISDAHAVIPKERLTAGKWFWRMRTMTIDGVYGHWSAPRSFTAISSCRKAEPERTVSREHPLFLLYNWGGDDLDVEWAEVPEHLKPHILVRIERPKTEDLLALCERTQVLGIPTLIQLVGPHDHWDGKGQRIPLADVEHILQRFSTVKGVIIVEQTCQGGLAQPRVKDYLIGLLRMVSHYGKIAVWADAQWHGNNIWMDAQLDEEMHAAMLACGQSLIPTWKMNCGWMPYAVQGSTFGLWMEGAVDNWGVEPEVHFWYEAGFHELDEQTSFKEGDGQFFPIPFWGQMALMGLSSGAALYSFEPPDSVWKDHKKELSEAGKRVVLPLLTKIIDWDLIPSKDEVKETTRIAYVASPADTPWRMDGGPLKTVYEGTYGFDHPYQMIPQTGRYGWIPVLSPFADPKALEAFSALLSAESFTTASAAREFFDSEYPSIERGTAWSVHVGSLWVVSNHHENRDITETFSLPLGGFLTRVEGVLEVNSYVILSEKAHGIVRIHANGRSDRKTRIKLVTSGTTPPAVEATPSSALGDAGYDAHTKTFTCVLDFSQGAVDLIVTANEKG